jgi:hypothetical protein
MNSVKEGEQHLIHISNNFQFSERWSIFAHLLRQQPYRLQISAAGSTFTCCSKIKTQWQQKNSTRDNGLSIQLVSYYTG